MSDTVSELKTALEKGETTLLEQWDEVKSYLRGAGFPMTKAALVEQAKSLKAPDDKYFEVATSSIAVAPTNPLFKPQFQDRQNPLYRG